MASSDYISILCSKLGGGVATLFAIICYEHTNKYDNAVSILPVSQQTLTLLFIIFMVDDFKCSVSATLRQYWINESKKMGGKKKSAFRMLKRLWRKHYYVLNKRGFLQESDESQYLRTCLRMEEDPHDIHKYWSICFQLCNEINLFSWHCQAT